MQTWYEQHTQDEGGLIDVLGDLALALLFLLSLIVAVRLLLDALGILAL